MLADGTSFSQSSVVSKNGQWPLYAPLYSGQGSLFCWISFASTPAADVSGTLSWIKPNLPSAPYYPAGFALTLALSGSHFTAPPSGTKVLNFPGNVSLVLSNGVNVTECRRAQPQQPRDQSQRQQADPHHWCDRGHFQGNGSESCDRTNNLVPRRPAAKTECRQRFLSERGPKRVGLFRAVAIVAEAAAGLSEHWWRFYFQRFDPRDQRRHDGWMQLHTVSKLRCPACKRGVTRQSHRRLARWRRSFDADLAEETAFHAEKLRDRQTSPG